MNNGPIVNRDPEIQGGVPVFAGTRVPVDSLTAHLTGGDTIDDFLNDFPSVTREQVEAYLVLAEQLVPSELTAK